MGRARIRAILAALRPPGGPALERRPGARRWPAVAGLMLLLGALLLSDAAARPVAAWPGLAEGLTPVAQEPTRADATRPQEPRADFPTASARGPAAAEERPCGWQPDRTAPAASLGSSEAMTDSTAPPPGPSLSADGFPAEPTTVSELSVPSRHRTLPAAAEQPQAAASLLERRLRQWPDWRLPAPLPRPGRQAPRWPAWFSGEWQVESVALPADPAEPLQPSSSWRARFLPDGHGGSVADRAFNAFSVGRSLLGERLLSVQDDPANAQRQLARLATGQLLETTLIGQRGDNPEPDAFLNDELSLQVLHGPGEPRLSRIETLGRWRLLGDGSIEGEQWQARYASPSEGLATAARSSEHWRLRLVPVPPGSDRATGTAEPAAGYH